MVIWFVRPSVCESSEYQAEMFIYVFKPFCFAEPVWEYKDWAI
jgi:hypothetical protein